MYNKCRIIPLPNVYLQWVPMWFPMSCNVDTFSFYLSFHHAFKPFFNPHFTKCFHFIAIQTSCWITASILSISTLFLYISRSLMTTWWLCDDCVGSTWSAQCACAIIVNCTLQVLPTQSSHNHHVVIRDLETQSNQVEMQINEVEI